MKIKKTFFEKTIPAIFACMTLFTAVSCSAGIDDNGTLSIVNPDLQLNPSVSPYPLEEKLYEVNFRMNYEGAYPSTLGKNSESESTRSSVATGNPLSGYMYYAEATCPGRETVIVESDEITENLAFKIMLGAATWKVKAYLKNGPDKIEVGSADVTVTEDNPIPEATISIVPRTQGEGRGFVNLSFGTLDSSIQSVELYNPDVDFTNWVADKNGIFTKPGQYIAPGIYNITIFFKNGNGEVVYSCRETINVYAGYTTDSWFGSSSYLETSAGGEGVMFNIPSRLIDNYVQTEIYLKSDATGDESTKSGTQLSPFKTLKGAFNRLARLNDGTNNFKIIVLSDITLGDSDFSNDSDGKTYALYDSDKNLDLSIEAARNSGYKITGSSGIRFFKFAPSDGKKVNVEFNHLEFSNGGDIDRDGGCICINPDGNSVKSTFTLRDVKINGFKADSGSALFAKNADIEFNGCLAYGNESISMGTICLSMDSALTFAGSSAVSGNLANSMAGGVYVGTNSFLSMKNGTIGGTAAYSSYSPDALMGNYLSSAEGIGCGVYVDEGGKFFMTGGTICGNKNADETVPTEKLYGNGIFIKSDTSDVRIGGSSVVSVDNDILLGWGSTLGISASLTSEKKYAARISLCEYDSPVPAMRNMTQIEDRISEEKTFIHGAGGYSVLQDDLDKIAITSTTDEYEKNSGSDRECGYKYYFANSSGNGIIKHFGIVVIPTLPGEYRFVVSSDQLIKGKSDSLSFTFQKKNESGTFESFIPDESILAICQNGDELFRVSANNGMISIGYDDPRIMGLFAGRYQIRMIAKIQTLIIDGISDLEILNAVAP